MRARLLIVVALGAMLAVVVLALHAQGIELRDVTPARLRDFLLATRGWAPLVYVAVYGQPLVPLPASVMILAAGLAFGPALGFVLAMVGSMTRALVQFGVVRVLGRQAIQHLLRGRLAKIDQMAGRHGFEAMLFFRLVPMGIPFDLQNIAFGLSPVSLSAYAVTTCLGLLPVTMVLVFLGHSLTDWRQGWRILLAIIGVGMLIAWQRSIMKRRRAASE